MLGILHVQKKKKLEPTVTSSDIFEKENSTKKKAKKCSTNNFEYQMETFSASKFYCFWCNFYQSRIFLKQKLHPFTGACQSLQVNQNLIFPKESPDLKFFRKKMRNISLRKIRIPMTNNVYIIYIYILYMYLNTCC